MEMDWKQHLQEENSSFDVLGEFQSKGAHVMAEQQHQLDDLSPLEHLQTSGYCSAAESDIESLLLHHALESVTLHPSTADMQHCLSVEQNSEIDLDWLSEFDKPEQEQKSPQQQLVNGTTGDQTLSNEQKNQEEPQAKPLPRLNAGVPCRARSKRRRRVRFPVPAATQQAPDSCSATITETQMQYALKMVSDIQKKSKSNRKSGNNSRRYSTAGPRRCSHCWTQKTPQWRLGPLGPKTLCNACGVRFMSGRLFPEYRPAKSPTFVSLLHSNCHRRVLQLRAGLHPFRIIPIPAPSFPSQSQLPHLS